MSFFCQHFFRFSYGYFVEPTFIQTSDPSGKLMNEVTDCHIVIAQSFWGVP